MSLVTVIPEQEPSNDSVYHELLRRILHHKSEAIELCEEMLASVRSHVFKLRDNTKCRLTMSIGLVLLKEDAKEFTPHKLVTQADNNLYQAKEQGRDRLIVSEYEN